MGILDDAIRQHLELKRRHGAESEDLERLEKEAFGPATRPGDPEFVDPDASVAAAPAAVDDAAPAEGTTTVAPVADRPSPEEATEHRAPVQLGPEAEAEAPSSESPAGGGARALGPSPAEPAASKPPEPPESGIFDAEDFDFGDLDLDLDDEDEPLLAEPTEPAQPGSRGPAAPDPQPMTPTTTDHDLAPAPVTPPAERPEAPAGGEEPGPPAEDLLEETPDFLQDAPEGEDLWFEQGPPRDFDFDDDDDD